MADTSTPYSTVLPLFNGPLPGWLNEYDATRLTAYKTYEDIYWGNPDSFRLVQRGSETNPIYIPAGKVIVNTMHRYAGKDIQPRLDPLFGSETEQALALQTFTDLFARERFGSQYVGNKRHGLMRGDWCWLITANPAKPQGSRITIRAMDPGMYFPIEDPMDVDRVLGCDIVEQILEGDKTLIKRQRYLKSDHPDHPRYNQAAPLPGLPISYQMDILEVENWETPQAKIVRSDFPLTELPITNLPVYHIKNNEEPGNPFGSSEMRGMERIIAAINQSITDEELSLALEGLGLYMTDAGAPVDENGDEVPWLLGPGRVVEVGADRKFTRVNGVSTVGPYQDHLQYLHDQLGRATGASDVAQGVVSVEVAESGIALNLRMSPILSAAEDKDTSIREVHNQMFYDLREWLRVYEGVNIDNTRVLSTFGDKLPVDNQKRFEQLLAMYQATPPLISAAYFRDACNEMGMQIPAGMGAEIVAEQAEMAAALDEMGGRLGAEEEGASDEAVV